MSAKRVRGTCPRCNGVVELTPNGRIGDHDITRGTVAYECRGVGRRPLEQLIPDRERVRAKRMAEVDAIRAEAAVLLDAYLARRDLADLEDLGEQLHRFRELAFTHYRVRYPRARPDACGYSWQSKMAKNGHVHCYCVFCGDWLGEMPVAWKVKNLDDVKERWAAAASRFDRHTTECALMVVAGLREPAAPGTRNSPAPQEVLTLELTP